MARRISRRGGDEVEIVGFRRQGTWVFRNPRSGRWQTSDWNVPNPRISEGGRHNEPLGGPTDAELRKAGLFQVRYRVEGRDYYRTERHPAGVAGRADRMLAEFQPPPPGGPGQPGKSPRPRKTPRQRKRR